MITSMRAIRHRHVHGHRSGRQRHVHRSMLGFPDCDFAPSTTACWSGRRCRLRTVEFRGKFPYGDRLRRSRSGSPTTTAAGTTDSEDVVVVDIANVVPSVTPPADQTAVEGSSKSFSLGSFTDPGHAHSVDGGHRLGRHFAAHDVHHDRHRKPRLRVAHLPDGPATKTVTVKAHRQE